MPIESLLSYFKSNAVWKKYNDGYTPCKHQYLTKNEGSVCLGYIERCGYFTDNKKVNLQKEFHEDDIKRIIESTSSAFNVCYNMACKETRKQKILENLNQKP